MEVRQLRTDLLRLNINAHRTQTLLDRKKIQQEQVFRLTRDLDNARNELSEIRSRQVRTKEAIEVQEKRRAAGVVGDDEIRAMTAELQGLKEREQLLMEREPQLAAELNSSQSALTQLDARWMN
jgi:hypothetical protein